MSNNKKNKNVVSFFCTSFEGSVNIALKTIYLI